MKVSYRVALVAVLMVVAVVYLTPTLVQPLPAGWPSFFPREPIRLGLDLQGGIHLILQVEVDKAVENSVDGIGEDLKRELATAQILTSKLERVGQTLRVRLASPEQERGVLRADTGQVPDPGVRLRAGGGGRGRAGARGARAQAHPRVRRRPVARDHPQPHRPIRRARADHPAQRQRRHPRAASGHPGSAARQGPDRQDGGAGVQAGDGRGGGSARSPCPGPRYCTDRSAIR